MLMVTTVSILPLLLNPALDYQGQHQAVHAQCKMQQAPELSSLPKSPPLPIASGFQGCFRVGSEPLAGIPEQPSSTPLCELPLILPGF
jgi:hypothetical protein